MFTTRPELIGTFGMVASTQWLASSAGMAILEKGGNAFDAAAAAGFVLQVVEPHLNGPGGDLPILFYSAEKHKVMVICGQGVAPAGATIERYRALDLDLVPGSGLLAATVPGAFDAWLLMLQEFGTLSLSDVIAPAIHYARDGYPLMPGICATIDIVSDLFRDEWPSSAALYLQNGAPPTAGTLFRNPDLAATYDRIVRESEAGRGDREMQIQTARRLFYRGFIAETIGEFCRGNEFMDTSGQRHRGFLTADDLATWQATIEEPLSYDYREAFYGDPNFVQVPMDQLLSDAYNDTRRGLIDSQASQELRPGDIPGFGATPINRVAKPDVAPRGAAVLGVAEDTTARYGGMRGDTCHLDVIDRAGNMVSATPSGGWLQSSPVIPGLGFALGTRAQMFWLQEGMPTSLAPGARPRTTLTPSLASRDSEPYMAFGTPGEDKQDQWSLTFFLRHVHFDMNLQEAIDAPMFHSSHFPGSFYPRESYPGRVAIEGRFSQDTIAELRRRGHDVQVENDWCLGRLSAVAKDGVLLKAAANPRYMQGYAVGR
jgi:gamma-glutamyltranspeptidase/glutathione hydrolase